VELAEARLNYLIGQTDLLLENFDEPCEWMDWLGSIDDGDVDDCDINPSSSRVDTYLANFRCDLTQARYIVIL